MFKHNIMIAFVCLLSKKYLVFNLYICEILNLNISRNIYPSGLMASLVFIFFSEEKYWSYDDKGNVSFRDVSLPSNTESKAKVI